MTTRIIPFMGGLLMFMLILAVVILIAAIISAAHADCQMPDHPDSQTTAWYYNCVQAEAAQQQYEIDQQAARLNALQDQMRRQRIAR